MQQVRSRIICPPLLQSNALYLIDPYNDAFLKQLPSHGETGPRWSIARPMLVVRHGIKHVGGGPFCDPFVVGTKMLSLVSHLSSKSRIPVAHIELYQLYSYTKMEPPAIDPESFFHAAVRELVDIDISEGKDRVERYLEMLRAATGTDFYNSVIARAIDIVTSSGRPADIAITLSSTLEWLSTVRLSEKRPKGVPLSSYEEKFACLKAYLLVSLLASATTSQLEDWPSDRRQTTIEKVFDESQMNKSSNSSRRLAKQPAEHRAEEYKALVLEAHNAL
jgi:hypothetical protein